MTVKGYKYKEKRKFVPSAKKGKTFEEMYGVERATAMKIQLSESVKKTGVWSKGLTAETDERIRKCAEAKTGVKLTEETKNKIRNSKNGIRTSLGMTGKNHTEETKNILRGKNTGRILGPHTKEHSDKISKSLEGNTNCLGNKHSEKTIRKMRELKIIYMEKNGVARPSVGKEENQILDEMERIFGCPALRQYRVCGYFVDGYIPEKNVIIEIDEPHHFKRDGNYTKRDTERQINIEKELGCRFIRIII